MVPALALLLLPSLLVMHACHDALYLCPRHGSACCDVRNGLYLCSGDRLACCSVCCGSIVCCTVAAGVMLLSDADCLVPDVCSDTL